MTKNYLLFTIHITIFVFLKTKKHKSYDDVLSMASNTTPDRMYVNTITNVMVVVHLR